MAQADTGQGSEPPSPRGRQRHRRPRSSCERSPVFDDKDPYDHPLSYSAEVTYEDLEGQSFGPEEYILDLRIFEGQAAYPKGLPELVQVVEDLRDEHKNWTAKGMFVRAVDEVTRERRNYRPIVIAKALRAKDNEGADSLAIS